MSIYDIENFTDSCLKCLLKYINKDSIKKDLQLEYMIMLEQQHVQT